MPECPNGHGELVESVKANSNGNDLRDYCPDCDFEIVSHTLYPHNDPEHPRYKLREYAADTPLEDVEPGPNPGGMCLCGCGQKTRIAPHTNRVKGHVAGQPVSFLRGHSRRGSAAVEF